MKRNFYLTVFTVLILGSPLFAQNNVLDFSYKNYDKLKEVFEALEAGKNTQTGNVISDEKNYVATQLSKNQAIDDVELFSAINPTNPKNIVISWMETTMTTLNFVMYYSIDAGITWNKSTYDLSYQGAGNVVGGGDPVFAFDSKGKCYFSWIYLKSLSLETVGDRDLTMTMYWAFSDDGGKTWERAAGGADIISEGVFFYSDGEIKTTKKCCPPDKQWMTVNPVTNDLFVSLTEFGDLKKMENIWGVRRLRAGSTAFEGKVLIPADTTMAATAGSLCADSKGNIHTVVPSWPDTLVPQQVLQYSYSSDNGTTYSTPVTLAVIDAKYFAGAAEKNETEYVYKRLNTMPYIAVDNSGGEFDGRVYVTWNGWDMEDLNGVDIYVSYTDDFGATWSEPLRVNQDEEGEDKTQHRPNLYVNDNGILIVGWYDGRKAYEGKEWTDYYIAVSDDGGKTFQEVNITGEINNDNTFDMQEVNPFWLVGEYYRFCASDDDVFAFWAAKSGGDVEIFTTKVSLKPFISINEISPITEKIMVHSIFPNPAEKYIDINFNIQENTKISGKIFNIEGKQVGELDEKEYRSGKNEIRFRINGYSKGTYFITLNTEYGKVVRKFIKE